MRTKRNMKVDEQEPRKPSWLWLAVLAVAFLVATCSRAKPPAVGIGPDVQASLVAVFVPGTSNADIDRFLEQSVLVGSASGQRGHRPGVRSILKVSVQHHDGYAVAFFPSATPDQRANIRADMVASPVVLKVFDDVAPGDIQPDQLVKSGT